MVRLIWAVSLAASVHCFCQDRLLTIRPLAIALPNAKARDGYTLRSITIFSKPNEPPTTISAELADTALYVPEKGLSLLLGISGQGPSTGEGATVCGVYRATIRGRGIRDQYRWSVPLVVERAGDPCTAENIYIIESEPADEFEARAAKAAKEKVAELRAGQELARKCRQLYRSTIDKAVKDLTVKQTLQIEECQALGLYRRN